MNIDYKNYMVFPYTVQRCNKLYPQDAIKKYGDQLYFLFQNGFQLQDNSLVLIEEQMMLFNNFKTYDDFEDLIKTFGKAFDYEEPTIEGYKIVDSVLELILTKSMIVGNKSFYDIMSAGTSLKETIKKMLDYFSALVDSDDIEVKRILPAILSQGASELLDDCLDAYDDEHYNVLLVKYQELYKQISEMHKQCYRALLSSSEKGLQARMGNVNDELYGSSGGYNPNDDTIKAVNGSLVFELKTLADKSKSTADLKYKMRVIAKEAAENGETDKIILSFANGNNSNLEKVRDILIQTDLSGCMTLLSLKHGLTLLEDSLNADRSKRIAHEFSAITKFVGLGGFDIA